MSNTQAQERALLEESAFWLHSLLDRPPQTPEIRGLLERLDTALATPPTAAPEGAGKELLREAAECLAWYYENPSPVDLIGFRQKQAAKLARKLRAAAAAPEGPQSAPAAQGREPLSPEKILTLWREGGRDDSDCIDFARVIEHAHGIGAPLNTPQEGK